MSVTRYRVYYTTGAEIVDADGYASEAEIIEHDDGEYVAFEDYERLRGENVEQARLLGMSSEREARLLAEVERLRGRILNTPQQLEFKFE